MISFKFPDLDFGQTWYVKNDPVNTMYSLVGLIILPGKQVRFQLSHMGELIELYDFECSMDPNPEIEEE